MAGVTIIGAGRVGAAAATRLAAAGHDTVCWDTRREALDRLPPGVRVAGGLSDAIADAGIVFTALPGTRELAGLMFDDEHLLDRLDPATVWIDLGSTDPALADRLAPAAADRDLAWLDAPIGGGPTAVGAGDATLYVGGDIATLDGQRAPLAALATRVHHVGGHGAGYVTKLLINLAWFTEAVITAETLAVATGYGIDPALFAAAVSDSAAASRFTTDYLPRLLGDDPAAGFGLDRCVEELDAITGLAERLDAPHRLAAAVTAVHHDALNRYGPADGELLAALHLLHPDAQAGLGH